MFATYLRILFIILALIGAVVLFAFAFTTAAIVVAVLVLIGLIFGRGRTSSVWIVRREQSDHQPQSGPVVIDHDPDDLPPPERK